MRASAVAAAIAIALGAAVVGPLSTHAGPPRVAASSREAARGHAALTRPTTTVASAPRLVVPSIAGTTCEVAGSSSCSLTPCRVYATSAPASPAVLDVTPIVGQAKTAKRARCAAIRPQAIPVATAAG